MSNRAVPGFRGLGRILNKSKPECGPGQLELRTREFKLQLLDDRCLGNGAVPGSCQLKFEYVGYSEREYAQWKFTYSNGVSERGRIARLGRYSRSGGQPRRAVPSLWNRLWLLERFLPCANVYALGWIGWRLRLHCHGNSSRGNKLRTEWREHGCRLQRDGKPRRNNRFVFREGG